MKKYWIIVVVFLIIVVVLVVRDYASSRKQVRAYLVEQGYAQIVLHQKIFTMGCGEWWQVRKGDITYQFNATKSGTLRTGKVTRRWNFFKRKIIVCEDD